MAVLLWGAPERPSLPQQRAHETLQAAAVHGGDALATARAVLQAATNAVQASEIQATALAGQLAAEEAAAGVPIPECVEEKAALLREVEALELPASSLDLIIAELGGPSCVAEMTGRKGRLVRNDEARRPNAAV